MKSPQGRLLLACEFPGRCWWRIWLDTGGLSGENVPSPGYPRPAPRPAAPDQPASGGFRGRALTPPQLALPRHRWSSCTRSREGSLALGDLIVLNGLEFAGRINAVEPGNIAADDLLFDLIGQIDAVLGFDILRQLEGHKVIELPLRVPDGEVGAVDDAVRTQPEEQVGHNLGKEAWTVVDKGESDCQRTVDVGAASGDPAEIIKSRQANVVNDEVQFRVEPGWLVDVAYIKLGKREWLDGGSFMEVHIFDPKFDALLIEREDH